LDTLEIQPNSLRLGQILTRERVITPDVLREAMARALRERLRLGETLVVMGAATTSDILRALATQQGMAFLAADELPSTPPALKELSPKYLRQYVACPIAVEAGTVTVATADPTNPQLLDELQQLLGLTVEEEGGRPLGRVTALHPGVLVGSYPSFAGGVAEVEPGPVPGRAAVRPGLARRDREDPPAEPVERIGEE